MDKVIGVVVATLIVGAAIAGMWGSWRRRSARDRNIAVLHELPSAQMRWSGRVQYVASTRVGEPLNRLAIDGLGFRGHAHMQVSDAGVWFQVDGSTAVAIPASAITTVGTASWAIDRGVGPNGLISIDWRSLGEPTTTISTAIRISDSAQHEAALTALTNVFTSISTASEQL